MRILLVADLHYSLKQFDWLAAEAHAYDLVVIAGDLLDLAGHADLDAQVVVVLKYLNRIRCKTPLIVCSGNHDGDAKNEAEEYICGWLLKAKNENLYVDGDSVELDGRLISVCPWWDGPVTRGEMIDFLVRERNRPSTTWIWIHHAPPTESPVSWTGAKDAGDSYLREFIGNYEPQFAFSGHIHNSPFSEGGSWVDRVGPTWVFNPGRQMGYLPSYIDLNLDEGKATWVSLAGVEEVDLTSEPWKKKVLG